MSERYATFEAVLVVILKGNEVLLHRRKNTGWMDGWFDVPGGHVDPGESILATASREVSEEVRLKVSTKDLEIFHISQADSGNDKLYTYFIFRARQWEGEPVVGEPDMAEDLKFYPLDNLPQNIPPYTKSGLENVNSKEITFSYFGPDKF
jgi:8-oxo-dGTP diphosphatase